MEEYQSQMNTDSSRKMADQNEHLSYPRGVKVGVVVLSVFALVLLVWQMQSRLTLAIPIFGDGSTSETLATNLLELEDEQLRLQDSDEDSLTDYEELRIYGSSPFIADTDSDGITDDQEVADGTDPNCPKGQNCFAQVVLAPNTGGQSESIQELQAILERPEEIRTLLIRNGADPEIVSQLDDQSLQILAQQALEQFQKPTQESLDILENLSITQMRDILEALGTPRSELEAITDEELEQIFQQKIDEERGNLNSETDTSVESTQE